MLILCLMFSKLLPTHAFYALIRLMLIRTFRNYNNTLRKNCCSVLTIGKGKTVFVIIITKNSVLQKQSIDADKSAFMRACGDAMIELLISWTMQHFHHSLLITILAFTAKVPPRFIQFCLLIRQPLTNYILHSRATSEGITQAYS